MNWFTKSRVAEQSVEQKTKHVVEHGGCEHVEKDPSKLVVISYENDSFGKEGYCLCEDCNNAAIEHDNNQLYTCCDCSTRTPLKQGGLWKWYDFYAAQGDRPLFVCNACLVKPKHIDRVQRDRADYEWEMNR